MRTHPVRCGLTHVVMAPSNLGSELWTLARQVAAILDEICAQYDEVGLCPSPGTPGQSPKGQTPRHSSNSSGDGSGPQQQQQQVCPCPCHLFRMHVLHGTSIGRSICIDTALDVSGHRHRG